MAGLLKPYDAYELVKALKETVSLPIQLHTHYTSGLASMTLLKAIEAGVDIVDTAISPMALGTSQPPTEALVATLAGTQYDTGITLEALDEITKYFAPIREKYLASGLLDPKMLKVDVNALIYQVPGGMLSNLVSQLKQAGKSDKLIEVLEEVPRVRADAGYPPLVTPSSQIVGTQAVFNVIGGERYKMVTKEFKGLVQGQYGRAPVEIDEAFAKKIIGDAERITSRPADALAPELDALREKIKPYIEQDEDVLSYALFEQVALKFFEYRKAKKYGIDADNADSALGVHTV
jgi:oxaloacetate decarboxylase alpha subunit